MPMSTSLTENVVRGVQMQMSVKTYPTHGRNGHFLRILASLVYLDAIGFPKPDIAYLHCRLGLQLWTEPDYPDAGMYNL